MGIKKAGPAAEEAVDGAVREPALVNMNLADLTPDAKNANRGTKRGRAMLAESLKQYGTGRSILIDKAGRIIAGNKTAETASKAGGMENVLVIQTDGKQLIAIQRTDLDLETDKAARELAIADNRVGQVGLEWDPDTLRTLDVDLGQFFTAEEQNRLVPTDVIPALLSEEDDAPELPTDPSTKPGDLYILGEHRLLCGDSTDALAVGRLMAGERAMCMWTDPPYGVSYVGKTKKALTIQNDGSDTLSELLAGAFACATIALDEGAAIYVAHPAGPLSIIFGNAWLNAGWRLHQTLVWDKATMVLGHSDYHYAHEPIYYGATGAAPKDSKAIGRGNYKDVHDPVFFGYTKGQGRTGRGGKGWFGNDSQRSILTYPKPARSEQHPTMKPVGLVEHCLGNSTDAGGVVLDLFGGSGTTLIACQKMGRRARLMELDPRFCDVIVKRWEAASGRRAHLEVPGADGATT